MGVCRGAAAGDAAAVRGNGTGTGGPTSDAGNRADTRARGRPFIQKYRARPGDSRWNRALPFEKHRSSYQVRVDRYLNRLSLTSVTDLGRGGDRGEGLLTFGGGAGCLLAFRRSASVSGDETFS